MTEEKRLVPRISVNAFVRFYREPFDATVQPYNRGVVKNYSKKGMHILTDHPLPKGTMLTVELPIESERQGFAIIQVRGTVRWVRHIEGRPGMGVEFLQFKGTADKDFVDWMADLSFEEKETPS